ncbi:unnamed protein product [Calypogeia fissa]
MVHNAFDCVQVLKDCPVKIESVGIWGARIVLGCIDGSLRIYAPEDYPSDALLPYDSESSSNATNSASSSSAAAFVPSYVHRDTRVGFAKKAVTSMNVLQSRGLLISLSDAVAIHTLPDFEVVSYCTKTKGATLYAWDGDRGYLAVAKQKRIFVYRYDGNREFVEIKDLAAPDVVKAMDWSNDSLCLGIRKEYVIMNINTGTTIDLFPCGRINGPLVVALPQGELLLGKDNIGVIVDHSGQVVHEGGFSWSEAPTTVAIHNPYALARLSRFIEVRSLRAPHGLVQMLALRDVNVVIATDAGLVAAMDYSIHRILPVPLSVQVVQLAASGNFEDALALCKMFPPEDAALRAAKEDTIHTRYGHHLFEQGDYAEAMEHFGASSMDLISILSLFPSIKVARSNPAMQTKLEETKDIEDVQQRKISLSALSGFLMARRGVVTSKAEAEETDAAVAAMVDGVDAKQSPGAERKEGIALRKTDSDGTEQYDARELATVLDTALVQALLATDNSQAALQLLKGPNYCDVAACKEMMLAGGHYMELFELYRSNKMHHAAVQLLISLADKPDSFAVQPDESQFGAQIIVDYLMTFGDQDPTFILESADWVLKNNPDQALLLFTSFSPPLPMNLVLEHLKERAPELRVFYLENMLGKRADGTGAPADLQSELMQLYLVRVVEERSELVAQGKWDEKVHSEAREKLLKALQNARTYSPDRMLQSLPADGLYEERAYLLGRLGQHQLALTLYVHKLHQPELALAYCDRVYQSAVSGRKGTTKTSLPALAAPGDQAGVNIYLTLLEVYLKQKMSVREYDRSIAGFSPAATIGSSKSFAALKPSPGQKGKGQVARKIAEIENAEDSKYSSTDSAPDSSRSDTEELAGGTTSVEGYLLDDALRLLSNRWDRFDGARALRMIPSDTKLEKLLPFLEPILRTSSEAFRNSSVIKGLHRSENLQVREELLLHRRRGVKVTSEQKCAICHKRIGTSVFAVYPNGTLAHFVCYRDLQPTAAGS